MTLKDQLDQIARLSEAATHGVFEYRIGDDLNNLRQVPCVIGDGLTGRCCVARFSDDPEGHADAMLFATLVNFWRSGGRELAESMEWLIRAEDVEILIDGKLIRVDGGRLLAVIDAARAKESQ